MEDYLYDNKLEFYPFRLINVEDKNYILSGAYGAIYELDEGTISLLKNKNDIQKSKIKTEIDDEELQAKLKQLEENFIIKTNKNYAKIEKISYQKNAAENISCLTLMICQKCNLRCRYCYGDGGEYSDSGEMSFEIASKAIDYLFNVSSSKNLSIIFFGGEPLLKFELIQDVVEYADEKANNCDRKIRYSITTNATLVNTEIAKFLAYNRFNVTVSIDGNEESNNRNRYYANGTGGFLQTINGIKFLSEQGVHISARATVCDNNCNDIFENLKLLLKENFCYVHFAPAANMMNLGSYDIFQKQMKKIADYFFACIAEKKYDIALKIRNINDIVNRIHVGGIRNSHCGAGNSMLAVDIHGELYPCHRFVSNKETQIGTLNQGIKEEKTEQLKFSLNESQCHDCWAIVLCGGGCPYENYQENKVIEVPGVALCHVMREVYDYILRKYLSMPEAQREEFFHLQDL